MEIPATSQGYGNNHTATYKGIKSTFHTLNLHSVICNVNPISGKLDEIDKRSDHSRKYKSKQNDTTLGRAGQMLAGRNQHLKVRRKTVQT